MLEKQIQLVDIGGDHGCRLERLAAGSLRAGGEPEQRQLSVADELVRLSAAFDHGLRHRAEEAVDDENGIERQPLFRKLGRAAHVHEHADQIALLADAGGT